MNNPPPSYEETVGSPGGYIPDDFNYSTKIGSCELPVRTRFINKVFNILSMQLCMTLASILVSFHCPRLQTFMIEHVSLFFLSMIVSIITCVWISLMPRVEDYDDGVIPWYVYGKRGTGVLLGIFTMAESYTVAMITLNYEYEIVLRAIVISTIVVLGISMISRWDRFSFLLESYTSVTYWLNCGLWIMIGVGLSSWFLPWSSGMDLVYGWCGAILFSVYLMVDLQLVLRKVYCDEEMRCAMLIYVDIINLFLSILRVVSHSDD